MTTSNTRILITLLIAFAVALPSLFHPSAAAARAEGSATAAAPSPSRESLQPAGLNIPDLPLPRILPCPPWFPKIPLIPCFNVTPPPATTNRPKGVPVVAEEPDAVRGVPHQRQRPGAADRLLRRLRPLLRQPEQPSSALPLLHRKR
ncbi:unnamed protein product [Urochloa humidicola]